MTNQPSRVALSASPETALLNGCTLVPAYHHNNYTKPLGRFSTGSGGVALAFFRFMPPILRRKQRRGAGRLIPDPRPFLSRINVSARRLWSVAGE